MDINLLSKQLFSYKDKIVSLEASIKVGAVVYKIYFSYI